MPHNKIIRIKNYLQRIIISYLKPGNCVETNDYFKEK